MKKRPAETFGVGGLVVPPLARSCFGERCPIERCYFDLHHLYFEAADYTSKRHSEIARKFRLDPFNIIRMARCAHDEYHQTTSGVPVPELEIMKRFLEEAKLLRDLEVNVAGYTFVNIVLAQEIPSSRDEWDTVHEVYGKKVVGKLFSIAYNDVLRDRTEEQRIRMEQEISILQAQASQIEVLPVEVIKRSARRIKRAREATQEIDRSYDEQLMQLYEVA